MGIILTNLVGCPIISVLRSVNWSRLEILPPLPLFGSGMGRMITRAVSPVLWELHLTEGFCLLYKMSITLISDFTNVLGTRSPVVCAKMIDPG